MRRRSVTWRAFLVLFTALGLAGCGAAIDEDAVGSGSPSARITLVWEAVSTNEDGTSVTDLAGYKLFFGRSPGMYTNVIDVGPVTSYSVTLPRPGTYVFAVVAYNAAGDESDFSSETFTSL